MGEEASSLLHLRIISTSHGVEMADPKGRFADGGLPHGGSRYEHGTMCLANAVSAYCLFRGTTEEQTTPARAHLLHEGIYIVNSHNRIVGTDWSCYCAIQTTASLAYGHRRHEPPKQPTHRVASHTAARCRFGQPPPIYEHIKWGRRRSRSAGHFAEGIEPPWVGVFEE
jgi:hypothetical protein